MTRTLRRALIAVSLLLALSSALSAQAPASFSVSGTVLSATTGAPLDRADVTLFTDGPDGSQVAASITGENGDFRFDRLQAGRYRIQAFRRGYIPAGYQEHDGFETGIVTGPHLVTAGLRLQLFPTAVIGGTITDDSGDPVPGAQVHLFRQDNRTGQQRVVRVATDVTDNSGSYEFDRLRAATFFISVSASPWYASHPNPKSDSDGNLLPAADQPRSPLDVAYPTTFYDNGTDSDSAAPIQVAAGDHVEADLSLHAVPAIHIQIRLPAPAEGRGVPMPQLMQQAFGSDQYQPSQEFTIGTKSGGMVADLSGIAPGHYILRQFGSPGETSRAASLDLNSAVSLDFASAATTGVDVSGKIAMASGSALPTRMRISLIPDDGSTIREGESVAEDGTFTFPSVAPGRYSVEAFAPDSRLGIQQMMATGAEVRGNSLTISAQPVLIAAILARGVASLNGFAKSGGKPFGGAMILLVPHDPAAQDLYRRDQTNTDGSFTLNRVIPGDYTLVAIDNGWTLDWANPAVIAPYVTRGLRLRVTGQRSLNLTSPVEVQPR